MSALERSEPQQYQTWQEVQADALDVQADSVELSILSLRRIEAMFVTVGERDQIRAFMEMLEMKNMNLRNASDKLRKEAR